MTVPHRVFVPTLTILVLLTACSSSPGSETSDPVPTTGPLDAYEAHALPSVEAERFVWENTQQGIAACMKKEGFTYYVTSRQDNLDQEGCSQWKRSTP